MRYSGTLRSWNDERGFGFIAQTGGGRADVFLHISELPRDGSRPTVGEKLTYELGRGKNGKSQAVNVIREAIGDTRNYKRAPSSRYTRKSNFFSKMLTLFILLALGAYGYKHYQRATSLYRQDIPLNSTKPSPLPERAQQAPLQNSNPVQDNVPVDFKCDGRTYCSQMTSCTEAKLFLKNCPGVAMDGNHDGVPCEQQWCTSPFAK